MIGVALGAWAGFAYWWAIAMWLEVPGTPHPAWCIIFGMVLLAYARLVRWARAERIFDDYDDL